MALPAFAPDLTVADALQQPVWTADPDGRVAYANPSWRAYTGLSEAASLDDGWTAAVHPDDVALIEARFAAATAADEPYEVEYRFRRIDGAYRWHLARVAPVRDTAGAIIGWAGTATDVDDRRQAEEALRASEAHTRAIIERAGDVIYTLELNGIIVAVNPAVERVLGYRPDDLIGRSVDEIIAPDYLTLTHEMLKHKLEGWDLSTYDLDVLAKDGRRVTLEVNSRLAVIDGRPSAIYGVARDVGVRRAARTERQARERQAYLVASVGTALTSRLPLPAQLQRSAEALVTHLDAVVAQIWTLDDEDEGMLVLRASAGIDPPPDDHQERIAAEEQPIGRIAAARQPFVTDAIDRIPDWGNPASTGEASIVAFAGYPLVIGERVLGVMGVYGRHPFVEPTVATLASVADAIAVAIERSHAETAREAALAREQVARVRAETAAATLATVNRVGRLLAAELDLERLVQTVTDAATALTGAQFGAFFYNLIDERGESYTLYSLAGVSPAAFAGYPMPRNTAIFGPTFRGEGVVRLADVRVDPRYGQNAPYAGLPPGHLPVVSYLAVPVVSRSGEVQGGLFFGHPQPGVFDERAEEIAVGLVAHAAVAIDNARLFRDAQSAESRYRGLFAGVADAMLVTDQERHYLDANPAAEALLGYTRDELVELRVEDIVALPPDWTETEFTGFRAVGNWQGELELRRKDGSTVAVDVKATVIELPEGAVHIAALRDVSERRAVEEQRQAFLEAVSHDLRNPLSTVQAQAQLVRRRIRRGAELEPNALDNSLAMIEAASQRIDRQLDELQDVVRLRAGQPLDLRSVLTDLPALVTTAIADVQAGTGHHRLIQNAGELTVIGEWDPSRVRRVVDNLLSNAVKYSPDGGTITIAVTREVRGDEDWAVLTVRDEGVGIPAVDLPHIFERYRRGSNVDWRTRGTGIGLAGVRQIVEQHGGTVTAESQEGDGSTFTVRLPLYQAEGGHLASPASG